MSMNPRFFGFIAGLGCFVGAAALAGYAIVALLIYGAIIVALSVFN